MTAGWWLGWGLAGIAVTGLAALPLLALWHSPYAVIAAMAAGQLSPVTGWAAGAALRGRK